MISQPKTSASRSQFKFPLIHQKLPFQNFQGKKKKKKKPPSDPSYSKFYTPPLVNILNGPSILHPPVLSIKLHTVRSNPSPKRCRSLPLQPKFKILLQGTMPTAANKNPSASSAPSTLSIPLYYYFRLSF